MKNIFSTKNMHTVTEANINYYAKPFIHPKRRMKEHDFIYLLKGEWKLGQNNENFTLKEDSLLILTAGNIHYGISACQKSTKTMYFHVTSACDDYQTEKNPEQLDDMIVLDTLIECSENKKIKKIFSEIVNSYLMDNKRKANLYFELLLCELNEINLLDKSMDTAAKIKEIIHRNPERFFSNKELAQTVNVSLKTAENKFKAMFGVTIHQYILAFKIKQAISYFDVFPEMSIKETALNLGFYDEYHFSRQFKKITGVSPSQFKNKN